MIRSCRIPAILSRICDDEIIHSALLVTSDGELLGSSSAMNGILLPPAINAAVAAAEAYGMTDYYNMSSLSSSYNATTNNHDTTTDNTTDETKNETINNTDKNANKNNNNNRKNGAVTNPLATAVLTENLGTLIADIAMDYQRLGDEYVGLIENNATGGTPTSVTTQTIMNNNNNNLMSSNSSNASINTPNHPSASTKGSHLQCLLLELDMGLIGVTSCGIGPMGAMVVGGASGAGQAGGGAVVVGAGDANTVVSPHSPSGVVVPSMHNQHHTFIHNSDGRDSLLVIVIASPNAPEGMVKAKLQTLAIHIQEALSPLTEST